MAEVAATALFPEAAAAARMAAGYVGGVSEEALIRVETALFPLKLLDLVIDDADPELEAELTDRRYGHTK